MWTSGGGLRAVDGTAALAVSSSAQFDIGCAGGASPAMRGESHQVQLPVFHPTTGTINDSTSSVTAGTISAQPNA